MERVNKDACQCCNSSHTHTPGYYPPHVYCNAPAVVSTLRKRQVEKEVSRKNCREKEPTNYQETSNLQFYSFYFLLIDSSDAVFNTASSIALVVWQMQRQFFKHLRVNSHLICSCAPWVKGLDQSGAMKIQIGSRNEADQCPVSSLYHHPTCIWPTFPGLETCLHSHLCSMCFCVGSIRKSFGSAMHCDCTNTCSAFLKHTWAADCSNEEENCLLYVSEKLFSKDSSPLLQEASLLNELVGIPELYILGDCWWHSCDVNDGETFCRATQDSGWQHFHLGDWTFSNTFSLLILPCCYNLKSKTAGQLEPTET